MSRSVFAAVLFTACFLPAAQKPSGSAMGENEDVKLTVTLYMGATEIKDLVGSDLGGHYFIADVKVEPKYGKEVAIDRDDFVLRTNKNGEKATPYVGSQVAGKNAIVLTPTKSADGGGVSSEPTYGGMPVPMGGPMGYPSDGVMLGGGGGSYDSNKATVKIASDAADNPLEKTLDAKILPQKKISEPISGLLYFPMEKQKLKDLELLYGGKENRISLRFK